MAESEYGKRALRTVVKAADYESKFAPGKKAGIGNACLCLGRLFLKRGARPYTQTQHLLRDLARLPRADIESYVDQSEDERVSTTFPVP